MTWTCTLKGQKEEEEEESEKMCATISLSRATESKAEIPTLFYRGERNGVDASALQPLCQPDILLSKLGGFLLGLSFFIRCAGQLFLKASDLGQRTAKKGEEEKKSEMSGH